MDWPTTRDSLALLANELNTARTHGCSADLLTYLDCVAQWGGDRGGNRGALSFVTRLHNQGQLINYFNRARSDMTLATADTNHLGSVESMNAMLTKMHALQAPDGLPIYDSRVSAALGAIVEIYRLGGGMVHNNLMFPRTQDRTGRTQSSTLSRPGATANRILYHGIRNRHLLWAQAKIRAGWLIEAALDHEPGLLANEGSPRQRSHAIEAGLFMLGYNVNAIHF